MKIWRKGTLALLLIICLTSAATPLVTLGATKPITSISVRVGTDSEAGDFLNENITLFTDTTETQSGTYVATNSARYYVRDAEWMTSTRSELAVGDEPKMKIYLEIEDSDYSFKGNYSTSNVTVKGGTFVSARKSSAGDLELTVKLSGIKGTYRAPEDAVWRDYGYGKAMWTMGEDDREEEKKVSSGYYDVYLYRGNSVVKKLEDYKGTTYDFYPYMTKKGTYKFKVRTVPHTEAEKKYGTRSDWTESDEVYLEEDEVSDGTGQTDGNGQPVGSGAQVGWIQSEGTWYYRYPDGSYEKDGWLKVNNKWYLFDRDGKMLTGWQKKDGLSYFLNSSGEMYIGWLKSGNYWYYLNRDTDGVEGAAHTGWLRSDGKIYYLNSSGVMLEGWNEVEGGWRYFYPGSGLMAFNTKVDTFYVDNDGIWKK